MNREATKRRSDGATKGVFTHGAIRASCLATSRVVLVLLVVAVARSSVAAGGPSLDELLGIDKDSAPSAEGVSPADTTGELERRLLNADPSNVFEKAVELMDDASMRLGVKRDAGLGTQRVQESVLTKLDQVIAEAARRSGSCKSSGAPKPDSGSSRNAQRKSGAGSGGQLPNTGTVSPGRVSRVTSDQPLQQPRREWGQLPPRLRAELLQGQDEPYCRLYQVLTEAYFRRLAQESK